MTYREIALMIKDMDISYAYYSFPLNQAPDLPYLVYYYPSNDDLAADDINYVPITNLNIELYTEQKDFNEEAKVEAVLKEYGIYFSKRETYIEKELMFEVLYQMQIVINEEN